MRIKSAGYEKRYYIKSPSKFKNLNSSNFRYKPITIQNLNNLLRDDANIFNFLFT